MLRTLLSVFLSAAVTLAAETAWAMTPGGTAKKFIALASDVTFLKGIMIDPEDGSGVFQYRYMKGEAGFFEKCAQLARERGRQVFP